MRQVLPKSVRSDAKRRSRYVILNNSDDKTQSESKYELQDDICYRVDAEADADFD